MNEDGIVGGGWYMEGGKRFEGAILSKLAKVWDGELFRVRGALEKAPSETNVLILSDSQAAIETIKKAGVYRKSKDL